MANDYTDELFGKRLAAIRRDRGMSQGELAERAGCSKDSIKRWELGLNTPALDSAAAIADVLGCMIDDLVHPFPVTSSEAREAS